ncbi:arabinanase [Geobacillus sp. PA-3]|nr:arabinanase [Geobacillus sp. PA-3]
MFHITVLPYEEAKLTAHYSFDNNDLSDSTGNFGPGTITGNRIDNEGGTIAYADGKIGKAAVLNGQSGIRLPDGLVSSNQYSVSLWVKPEQLTTHTTTFFGAKDPNHWVSLVPQGWDGNTMLWSGSSPWYDGRTFWKIPTGQWTHLAFSVDNGAVKVYINGVEKFSGTNFPDIFNNTNASFALGVNWWDPPFKGLIDELRIYEGALTPSQVANLVQINQ